METDKIIESIYQGATMATDSITNLIKYVDNDEMLDLMLAQQEKYYKLKAKSKLQLEKMGITEVDELKSARAMAKMVMGLRMSISKTKQKVASMLYRGAYMGLQQLAEGENRLKQNNEPIPEICKEYRNMLVSNQKELEKYL